MGNQRSGPVLGKDTYSPDPGVHEVAQGKINDPKVSGKGQGGFGTVEGQNTKFIHPASGQDKGQDIGHQILLSFFSIFLNRIGKESQL
jgi:hypothetical protein